MAIALSIAFGLVDSASSTQRSPKDQKLSGTFASSKPMADGKEWTTTNLNVNTSSSYCYDDAEANCRRYGRLYTWESAQRGCQSLGNGWRLPTDDEWREMATRYGGLGSESPAKGKAAYWALLSGGTSGFNAVLGGNRWDGKYDRLEGHGIYWTASENDSATAPFYNFGKGSEVLYRQPQGAEADGDVRALRQEVTARNSGRDIESSWNASDGEVVITPALSRSGFRSRWPTIEHHNGVTRGHGLGMWKI